VRKTAVLGVLKVFHLAPGRIKESDMVATLYSLLQDPDAHVRGGGTIATHVMWRSR
jgi:vesicle coat complex subunit